MATRSRRSGVGADGGTLNPTTIHFLDVRRLRDELQQRGLDTTGTKQKLADRLEEAVRSARAVKEMETVAETTSPSDESQLQLEAEPPPTSTRPRRSTAQAAMARFPGKMSGRRASKLDPKEPQESTAPPESVQSTPERKRKQKATTVVDDTEPIEESNVIARANSPTSSESHQSPSPALNSSREIRLRGKMSGRKAPKVDSKKAQESAAPPEPVQSAPERKRKQKTMVVLDDTEPIEESTARANSPTSSQPHLDTSALDSSGEIVEEPDRTTELQPSDHDHEQHGEEVELEKPEECVDQNDVVQVEPMEVEVEVRDPSPEKQGGMTSPTDSSERLIPSETETSSGRPRRRTAQAAIAWFQRKAPLSKRARKSLTQPQQEEEQQHVASPPTPPSELVILPMAPEKKKKGPKLVLVSVNSGPGHLLTASPPSSSHTDSSRKLSQESDVAKRIAGTPNEDEDAKSGTPDSVHSVGRERPALPRLVIRTKDLSGSPSPSPLSADSRRSSQAGRKPSEAGRLFRPTAQQTTPGSAGGVAKKRPVAQRHAPPSVDLLDSILGSQDALLKECNKSDQEKAAELQKLEMEKRRLSGQSPFLLGPMEKRARTNTLSSEGSQQSSPVPGVNPRDPLNIMALPSSPGGAAANSNASLPPAASPRLPDIPGLIIERSADRLRRQPSLVGSPAVGLLSRADPPPTAATAKEEAQQDETPQLPAGEVVSPNPPAPKVGAHGDGPPDRDALPPLNADVAVATAAPTVKKPPKPSRWETPRQSAAPVVTSVPLPPAATTLPVPGFPPHMPGLPMAFPPPMPFPGMPPPPFMVPAGLPPPPAWPFPTHLPPPHLCVAPPVTPSATTATTPSPTTSTTLQNIPLPPPPNVAAATEQELLAMARSTNATAAAAVAPTPSGDNRPARPRAHRSPPARVIAAAIPPPVLLTEVPPPSRGVLLAPPPPAPTLALDQLERAALEQLACDQPEEREATAVASPNAHEETCRHNPEAEGGNSIYAGVDPVAQPQKSQEQQVRDVVDKVVEEIVVEIEHTHYLSAQAKLRLNDTLREIDAGEVYEPDFIDENLCPPDEEEEEEDQVPNTLSPLHVDVDGEPTVHNTNNDGADEEEDEDDEVEGDSEVDEDESVEDEESEEEDEDFVVDAEGRITSKNKVDTNGTDKRKQPFAQKPNGAAKTPPVLQALLKDPKQLLQHADLVLQTLGRAPKAVEIEQMALDESYVAAEPAARPLPDFHGEPVPDEADDDALFELAAGLKKRKEDRPIEEERLPDDECVELDYYNADMNVKAAPNNKWLVDPDNGDGFALMWGCVRSNYGVVLPADCSQMPVLIYQVKITDFITVKHLPFEETDAYDLRVGWSAESVQTPVGEAEHSYCYSRLGRKAAANHFLDFGRPAGQDDVITVALDLQVGELRVFLNNDELGLLYRGLDFGGAGQAIFPHIGLKNLKVHVNFGVEQPEPDCVWDLPDALKMDAVRFVGQLDRQASLLRPSTRPPDSKADCTVIMMVGLPGAGKTYWVRHYLKDHPDEQWVLLNTENIINLMKVNGVARKRVHRGRWDMIMGLAAKALSRTFGLACRRRHNYIIDQTNVSRDARKRKLQLFKDFVRKCVVVVPPADEFEHRQLRQARQETGSTLPAEALLELKGTFTLPETEAEPLEEVIFVEPPLERIQEAIEQVQRYNDEGRPYLRTKRFSAKPAAPVISDSRQQPMGSW